MPDRVIQLSISEGGSESGAMFTFHLDLDGTVLASNQGLTVPQSQAVRELSFRYGLLFEQRRLPQLGQPRRLSPRKALPRRLWPTPARRT